MTISLLLLAVAASYGQDNEAGQLVDKMRALPQQHRNTLPRAFPGKDQQFPKTLLHYRSEFLPGTASITELMTPEGDVYLFRVIDQKYIPGFVGAFAKEEGAISYSLNPYIAKMWDSPRTRNANSTLLIARNNVRSDALVYPTHADYIGQKYKGRLEPGTKISDIRYLNEVKVPIPRENVLRAMPLSEFQRFAESFGAASFGLDELLTKTLTQ